MPNDIDAALDELRRRHTVSTDQPTGVLSTGDSALNYDDDIARIRREKGNTSQQEQNPEPVTPTVPSVKPVNRQELALDSLDLSLRHASTSNPAAEAERRNLANRLGVDKQMVPDPETARQELFLKENDPAELLRTNPEIAKYLEDLDNATIAGQDISTLKTVTGIMRRLAVDPLVMAAKTTVAVPQSLAGVYKIYDRAVKSLIPDQLTKAVDDATPQQLREALGATEASLGGLVDFKQTQDFTEQFYSPETLAAKAKVQKAQGFFDTVGTALENPSSIVTTVGESIGPMLLGGAAAQTIIKAFPALSPLVAGAIGEGVTIAGSTAQGMTEDTGKDLTGQQALLSVGAGALGAGIGVLGGKIMQKMGVTDIDTALAKGTLDKALRDSKMPQSLIARVTAGAVGEGVLEEMPQSAIEQIAHNVGTGKPWDEGVENAMAMGMLAGAATGGTIQAFTPKAPNEGLNKAIDDAAVDALRDVGRAQQAADNKQTLEEFSKAVSNSSLRKNSPEEFKKFVRTMADEGQMIEEVYVDPKTLNEAFAQSEITPEEIAEKMPELAKEMQVAEQAGTDVRISFDDYATYIAGSKAETGIIDHLRTTPEGMTYSESQLFQQDQTKILTEQAKKILDENQPVLTKAEFMSQNPQGDYKQYQVEHQNKREVFAVDAQQVHDDLLEGLNKAGRFNRNANAVYAVPFREFYATAAAKEGILPSELYKRMPLNFQNVKIEDGLLDQPNGVFGQFAGQQARTMDASRLDEAIRLTKDGRNPGQVHEATGWHQGVDGKWRFEIDDSQSSINESHNKYENIGGVSSELIGQLDRSLKLPDILTHDALYEAYPELADVDVSVYPAAVMAGARGSFAHRLNRIDLLDSLSIPEARSVLLHEIQHAIQYIEGFAVGGSPETSKLEVNRLIASMKANKLAPTDEIEAFELAARQIADIKEKRDFLKTIQTWRKNPESIRKYSEWFERSSENHGIPRKKGAERTAKLNAIVEEAIAKRLTTMFGGWPLDQAERYLREYVGRKEARRAELVESGKRVREFMEKYPNHRETLREISTLKDKSDKLSPFEIYERLAGEVEARNTQWRRNYTAAERGDVPPEMTQDISNDDQIVVTRSSDGRTQLRTPDAQQTNNFSNANGRARTIAGLPPQQGFEQQTKIRGRDGTPLTVFRGSKAGLSDAHFQKAALGKASGKAPSGRGVHFTTNRNAAQVHGDVREFQLDIRNPFTFKADDESIPAHDTAEEYFEWREGLRAQGFDGIVEIASHLGGPNTIIAFDPQQVIEKPGVFNQSPVLTDTITVDGIERPTTNSEGKKIHPTVEGVQNFWRWFGDSKVVDAQGRPLVVYHGTNGDFTEFDTSDKSLRMDIPNNLGENIGAFFAANRNHAKDFGENVESVYLNISDPKPFKDQEALRSYMREHSGRTPDVRDAEGFIVSEGVFENNMRREIEADGFNGAVIERPGYTKTKKSDRSWYIAFDPNQIKSIDNIGNFSPDDNNILNQSAFYSALSREIGGLKKIANKQGMVKPEQAIQWITARQKEGKFKAAEVDAVGVLDWLAATKEPVSVSDVEQFVQANGIQIEETVLRNTLTEDDDRLLSDLFDEDFIALEDRVFYEFDEGTRKWQVFGEHASEDDVYDTEEEARNRVSSIIEDIRGVESEGEAKFGDYVLPGGENYRELLMRLPVKGQSFRSSHFDQENIVAHVRLNEREADTPVAQPTPEMLAEKAAYEASLPKRREIEEQGALVAAQIGKEEAGIFEKLREEALSAGKVISGVEIQNRILVMPPTAAKLRRRELQAELDKLPAKPQWMSRVVLKKQKVLFIEEIQSDWAQEGRKKGFGASVSKTRTIRSRMREIEVEREDGARIPLPEHKEEWISLNNQLQAAESGEVPPGPFLENTKDWTALAFKRMLRYAAENGFDKIAWTTGEQQADRYSLRRKIETLDIVKEGPDKYTVYGTDDNDGTMEEQVDGKWLRKFVGETQAAEVEGLSDGESKLYENVGLDYGGEGMVAYYDNIVPQVVADVMKKLKGPKAAQTEIDEIGAQPSIDITPELRAKVMEGLPLFQDQSKVQNRASYDPTNFTISLLKGADLSSVIHEGGHFYLEALADMASQPQAIQQVKDDFRKTLNWFGIDGPDPEGLWRLMTLDQKRQYHEQWAQSFERYALEGKSPTLEMQPVFARFRRWMLSVYKSLKEFLKHNPLAGKLNDDVRQIFDRLLAADEAIKEAEKAREYAPLFANANDAGVTDAEFQTYMEQGKTATELSLDELGSRSLKDMQWLSGAKSREVKKLQRQADAKRKVIRQEVMDEVLATPVHRAMTFLRSGKITRDDGSVETLKEHKLNSDDIRDIRPGMDLRSLPGMTKPDGLDPDFAAQLFGFESGDALITAILNEPKAAETISALTDKRMLEEHGDLVDPESISRAADKAIHNEARARFTATGLMMLAKKEGAGKGKGAVNQVIKAAKQAAESVIEAKKIRDLNPNQFTMAEKRANKEAIKFAGKQDNKRAFEAQRAALINNKLYIAARDAKDEVEKAIDFLKKFDSPAVRKKLDIDYLEQIDDLKKAFDLRKGVSTKALDKRQSLADWIDEQEANGFEPAIDPALMDELKRKHYKDMTMGEIRGLVDSIKQIERLARMKKELLTAKDKKELQARVDEADDAIRDNANRTVPERGTPTDVVGITAQWMRKMAAMHRKFNSIIREMDGGKDNGVMWNLLARPMNEAGDLETEMKQVAATKIAELFKDLPKDATVAGNLYAKKRMVPGTNLSMTHEQRVMFAMNWGNEGNRQRLLDGGITGRRALSIKEADAVLDTLTKEEWDFVQGVWDYIGTYKDQIKALEKRLTGVEPEWVDPTPVKTKFGTYAGGYFPAKYDTELSSRSESLEAVTDLRMGMKGAFQSAAARNGYTKARADQVINRPLLLSYNVISQHVSEVTHRLAWQPWLIDANRLLKALDAPIREHYGAEILRELRDTVVDIAQGDAPAKNATEQAINRLRKGSTVVGMGWRFTTAAMQVAGLTQSWSRIGTRWIAAGTGQYMASPLKSSEFVNQKSKLMKDRGITMQREINEVLNTIRAGEKVSALTASYFTLIGKMQRTVDIPTWLGAYEKGLHGLKYQNATDEKQRKDIEDHAAALADQAVLDAQSGGQIKDLAKVQRGSPAWKLFTNFYSYFSAAYNLNIEAVRRTSFKSPSQVGLLAADMILINILPIVFAVAVKNMFKGGCEWDDVECFADKYAQEQISHFMGQNILLREAGAAVSVATGGGGYGYQGPAGLRFFGDLYKAGAQINQGEADMALFKAVNSTAGALLHYPAGQINATVEGIMAVERGDVEGISILPALLAGPPRD